LLLLLPLLLLLLLVLAGLPWCGLDLVCLQLAAHEQVRGGGPGQGPQGQRSVMCGAEGRRWHDLGLQVGALLDIHVVWLCLIAPY
jgi:hypothetical protein